MRVQVSRQKQHNNNNTLISFRVECLFFAEGEEGKNSMFMGIITRPTDFSDENLAKYGRDVFKGIFELEMQKKIGMNIYKNADKPPAPLVNSCICLIFKSLLCVPFLLSDFAELGRGRE